MNRCLLIGGTGVKTHYEVVNGDIINCTFDSMSTGIYADRTTCNLNLMNTIFNNCDVGLRELCDVNCCGTIIYDCEYDTVDIAKTIEYFDLDPQIDSTRTARADSALTIGKNQMGQLFAPIYDKKGKWFRSNEGIPAIGYASPYESESWPQNENNEILWGIKTSGRSMK